ncbi:MAG: O-antigen ligase family protein [Elusimicrobiota bacterium]
MIAKKEIIFTILAVLVAVLFAKMISIRPTGMPIYAIAGILVVLITIIDTRIAIGLLVMSMLLSPEITLAQVPHRSVVVRFDDLMLALIFFVWLIKTAIDKKLPLIKRTPINKYIYYYLAACFLFTVKGIIFGDVRLNQAFFYLLKYTEYFILFWMVYNIIKTKNDIKLLMTFAVITAIVVMIYGYTKIGTVVAAPFDDEPGSFGGYLTLVVAVALGIFVYHRALYLKICSFSIFLFSIPLFIRAQSRASYISFAVMYISFIFLTGKFRKTLVLIGALTVMIVPTVFSGSIYKTLKERVGYTFSGNYGRFNIEPSGAARLISWKNSLINRWIKKPVTGWGITGVGFIDSQYVRTLIELGVLGAAAFLLMLYKIFTESRKILKQTDVDWEKGIITGFMAGFIALLFHALTTNTFIIVRIMEPFWFLCAVVFALPKIHEDMTETKSC